MSSSSPPPANASASLDIDSWPQHVGIVFNNNVRNSTTSRLCGVRNLAPGLLDSCCTYAYDKTVYTNQGAQYCLSEMKLRDFSKCMAKNWGKGHAAAGNNSHSYPVPHLEDTFCESNINGTVMIADHEKDSSSAIHSARTPRTSLILVVALLFSLFFSTTTATISPSLSTNGGLHRRSSSCSLSISTIYTTVNPTPIPVSPELECTDTEITLCDFAQHIDTGLSNNNRTLNGTSAADAKYDSFFDHMALQTKRGYGFPAQSSIVFDYEFFSELSRFRIGFQAVSWCVKGSVTNCKGHAIDSDGTVPVEVCGPLWVNEGRTGASDPGSGFWTGLSSGVQGIFSLMEV